MLNIETVDKTGNNVFTTLSQRSIDFLDLTDFLKDRIRTKYNSIDQLMGIDITDLKRISHIGDKRAETIMQAVDEYISS